MGLLVGLSSGTGLKLAVVGGVLTIAVADALSDALGIHISEESEATHTPKQIWASTLFTFVFKFLVASSFILPVVLLRLSVAVFVSIIWGLFLLGLISFYLAFKQKASFWKVALEHWFVAFLVIISSHFLGGLINRIFT